MANSHFIFPWFYFLLLRKLLLIILHPLASSTCLGFLKYCIADQKCTIYETTKLAAVRGDLEWPKMVRNGHIF